MCDDDDGNSRATNEASKMKREIPPASQIVAASPGGSSQTRWQLDQIVAEL
jgi:hypothetical protein